MSFNDDFDQGFDQIEDEPPLYCTRFDMEVVFSELGIDARFDDSDDDVTPQSDVEERICAVIQDATDEMNIHLLHRYEDTVLATSRWVRRKAAIIACYFASRRRGNPGQFADEYDRIMAQLDRIRKGRDFIPRLPTRFDPRPTVANMVVDRRYRNTSIRVDQESSSPNVIGENPDIHYLGRYYHW